MARPLRLRDVLTYLLLLLGAAVMLLPFLWMVSTSLKTGDATFVMPPELVPSAPTLDNYVEAVSAVPFVRFLFNSLFVSVTSTVLMVLFCAMAGYAFARIRFPGQNLVFMVVLLALLVPSEVTIVPLFRFFLGLGLVNTHWPLILVPILGAPCVLATFIMRQFFITLPPELEEAGRIDGLGRFGLFWRIALPLARPALGAVAIFTFLHSWNLYLEPIVFLSSTEKFTLPQALTQYVDAYGGPMWNIQLAAATLTALPVLIVFVIAQKQFVEGLAHTGLKG